MDIPQIDSLGHQAVRAHTKPPKIIDNLSVSPPMRRTGRCEEDICHNAGRKDQHYNGICV